MVIPDYDLITSYCRPTREHGGTAIYVNNRYGAEAISVREFCMEMHFECSVVKLAFGRRSICVLSVYRPPKGNFDLFLDQLFHTLELCSQYCSEIFLCGDLNINYLVNSSIKQSFDDLLLCYSLKVTSMTPTRVVTNYLGQTSISKVDYILTNVELCYCMSNIYEAHLSDHRICCLSYSIPVINTSLSDTGPKYREFRDLSDDNLNNLAYALARTGFNEIYSLNLKNSFTWFLDILSHAIELCCPVRRFYSRNKTRTPWVTSEVIQAPVNS